MGRTKTIDGIRVSRIDDEQELSFYQHKLIDRFQGDRYKAIVTIDTNESNGRVRLAMVHIIDLHNPHQLWVDATGKRFWLEPVQRSLLSSRTTDGSPYIGEVREIVHKFLRQYDDDWRVKQGNYGYVCIDMAVRPADEMDDFLYGIIM